MRNHIDERKELEDKLNDSSLYGEFVSTFHYWISSEELHNRAIHLQQLGKKD